MYRGLSFARAYTLGRCGCFGASCVSALAKCALTLFARGFCGTLPPANLLRVSLMLQNPVHLRLAKLESWQHMTFMACLCERMFPNY